MHQQPADELEAPPKQKKEKKAKKVKKEKTKKEKVVKERPRGQVAVAVEDVEDEVPKKKAQIGATSATSAAVGHGGVQRPAASQSPAKAKPMSKAKIDKAELEATKNRLNTMLTHTQMNFQSRQHKIKTEFEAKVRELKEALLLD